MTARLLLLLAIFTSFVAGPTAVGGWSGMSGAGRKCGCCALPAMETCCESPSGSPQQPPITRGNAPEGQLKLAIEPIVALLPARHWIKPSAVEVPRIAIGSRVSASLIDRICIRLI